MKKSLKILLLMISLAVGTFSASSKTPAKDFIFDFGGVLISTDKIASFRHIGIMNIAACSFQLGINPLYLDTYIKLRLFEILDQIAALHNIDTDSYQQTYDEKGNKLPKLMNGWLQGLISTKHINILIQQAFAIHPEWFKCQAEKRIIQNIAELIFTPEIFISSRKISPACIAFIKKCKKQGHNVYGLSNWDSESFALLKKEYADVFDLFDGIIISAEVKSNKPHAPIYQALLDRYQLQPENCWFIDDQQENIDAAQKLGINAVRHSSTFVNLIKNIKTAYASSVSLRKNLINNGNIATNANTTSNAMIRGENTPSADSTKYNCLPANA